MTEIEKEITQTGFFSKIENLIEDNWYPLALGLFSFPFWCLMVAVFGFIVGIPVTKYHAIAAFILSIVSIAWACEWKWKKSLVHSLLFITLLSIATFITSLSFDISYDGISYHKVATLAMNNGWNPIWQYHATVAMPSLAQTYTTMWATYYPKADWIVNTVGSF
jgi:hypothetical protein